MRVLPARQRQKPNWAKPEMARKISLPSLSSTPECSATARRKSSRSASIAALERLRSMARRKPSAWAGV